MNIETICTIITDTAEQDAPDIFQAILNSIETLRAFPASIPWSLAEPSLEQTREFCLFAQQNRELRHDLIHTVRLKSNRQMVGMIGLHKIDWSVPRFEIGFWGNVQFRGQGLMREAIGALLDESRLHYSPRRVEALIDAENIAARNLCTRLGFTLEGINQNARRDPVSKALRNHCVYALYSESGNQLTSNLSWPQLA